MAICCWIHLNGCSIWFICPMLPLLVRVEQWARYYFDITAVRRSRGSVSLTSSAMMSMPASPMKPRKVNEAASDSVSIRAPMIIGPPKAPVSPMTRQTPINSPRRSAADKSAPSVMLIPLPKPLPKPTSMAARASVRAESVKGITTMPAVRKNRQESAAGRSRGSTGALCPKNRGQADLSLQALQ